MKHDRQPARASPLAIACVIVIINGACSSSPGGVVADATTTSSAPAPTATSAPGPSFALEPLRVIELAEESLPYATTAGTSLQDSFITDRFGVRMVERDGVVHYHPVTIAQRGLSLHSSFVVTSDRRYLDLAMAHADRLIEESVGADGAIYFPYTFDFALHGRADALVPSPWYSAMAQGQAMSLFSRLYESSGEKRFLQAAEETFLSFQRLRNDGHEPWTVQIDEEGFLWLEEYPTPEGDHHALNGHNFAAYGLYDYYMLTGQGLDEFRGALTTVLRYFEDYRNPNGLSYYELKYGVTSQKYHEIHIAQLSKLAEMTGERRFAEMARILICDEPPVEPMTPAPTC